MLVKSQELLLMLTYPFVFPSTILSGTLSVMKSSKDGPDARFCLNSDLGVGVGLIDDEGPALEGVARALLRLRELTRAVRR